MSDRKLLDGRVAIVTGASRGIGAAAARAFAEAGATVVLAARTAQAIAAIAEEISAAGGRALAVPTDVTDPESVERLVKKTLTTFGRLDAAFNNAGAGQMPKPLADISFEDFEVGLKANLYGSFLGMKYEIPAMLAAGGGAIVNMSSTAGLQGAPGMGPYSAAKHGVVALTKSAALDYGKSNIRVNAIAPGPTVNEQMSRLPEDRLQQISRFIPLGRLGRTEEVARAAVWLCSDDASFITGAVLSIDGGRLAGGAGVLNRPGPPAPGGGRPPREASRAGGESRGNTSAPKDFVGSMDYGRPILFGYFILPDSMRPMRPLELAVRAEELGIDLIGAQDHPYQRRFYDTWTLLTAIAMRTKRVSVFPDVANLPLRPAAMLAKAAASLDVLSGGRVELGLGAGGFWEAIKAMGGPVRSPGEAVSALEEAIEVIRLVWSGGRGVRFDGKFYQLAGLNAGPVPVHPIGIWLGAYRPRMLRLVGRAAEGWVPSYGHLKTEAMPEANARIDDGAREAGRDPAAIRRVLNVAANLTADEIAELALEHGFDTFVIGETQEDVETELREFLENVAPKARELVAKGRESN